MTALSRLLRYTTRSASFVVLAKPVVSDGVREVREEIKCVLEEIDDLVVYGRAAIVIARNIDEIALHVRDSRRETTQRSELL
jgi:hypothetical protein